ncbi:MAG: DUF362 domain-containing protein [Planctomycetota bacterium]
MSADHPQANREPQPARVALARCEGYSPDEVARAVSALLAGLGGIERFLPADGRVLLKPNLLKAVEPDAAVTTHPEVLRAVGRAVLDAGREVAVGDSPGVGTLAAAMERSGLGAVARELGAAVKPFDEPVPVPRPGGARFRRVELARAAVDAPAIINLPKVKTHQQMVLTLAVKNLFGCVVGRRKVGWHMNAGRDRNTMARALVEIAHAAGPSLSIADAVVGMEGAGPSQGDLRRFGFLAASADPFSLDAVLAWLLGFEASEVPTLCAAADARGDGLDVGETELGRIELVGDPADELRPPDVRPPALGGLMFVPGFLTGVARRLIRVRPAVDRAACRLCGVCVESCPAGAMKIVDRRVEIDDTSCVGCFCCQELCPQGAVQVRRGPLSRFFSR